MIPGISSKLICDRCGTDLTTAVHLCGEEIAEWHIALHERDNFLKEMLYLRKELEAEMLASNIKSEQIISLEADVEDLKGRIDELEEEIAMSKED